MFSGGKRTAHVITPNEDIVITRNSSDSDSDETKPGAAKRKAGRKSVCTSHILIPNKAIKTIKNKAT